mmetsp:Transcript_20764/g.29261  ORF Transcript_20764/g.29261 Transcript_20764/m.29261 type:complete len:97 (-) Transcript_20764:39-329(-)
MGFGERKHDNSQRIENVERHTCCSSWVHRAMIERSWLNNSTQNQVNQQQWMHRMTAMKQVWKVANFSTATKNSMQCFIFLKLHGSTSSPTAFLPPF